MLNLSSRFLLISGLFYFWLSFFFIGLDEEHFIMFALISIFFILYSFLRNILSHSFFSQTEFIYLFFLYLVKLNLNLLDKFFLYNSILNFQLKFNHNFTLFDSLNIFLDKLVVFNFNFWYSSLNFLVNIFLSNFVNSKISLNFISELFVDMLTSTVNNFFKSSLFIRFSAFRICSDSLTILKNCKFFFK